MLAVVEGIMEDTTGDIIENTVTETGIWVQNQIPVLLLKFVYFCVKVF